VWMLAVRREELCVRAEEERKQGFMTRIVHRLLHAFLAQAFERKSTRTGVSISTHRRVNFLLVRVNFLIPPVLSFFEASS